ARSRGWRALALNFRGCSGDMNRLVRSYHSGETGDLDELVRRARGESDRILLAGCSLGGNVLVKWLGEQGDRAPREVKAAAALCRGRPVHPGAMHPARDQPAGRAGDLPAGRTPGLRRRADLGYALLRRAARGGVPGSAPDRPALMRWDPPERSTLEGWRTP